MPVISFTFDDFPRSALLTGGAILERFSARGTYYASFGLMDGDGPTGQLFRREDLSRLLRAGHELGCHTFAHCHSWETSPRTFEQSVIKNMLALTEYCPDIRFRTLAYPISPPRPLTKRAAGRRFSCCRGGGQTFNAGTTDLNYLSAYFMEKSRDAPDVLKGLIEQNCRARGWLIFATHDVSDNPTPFGCTPGFFEDIVGYAASSGALILPVSRACEMLCQ